MSLLDAPQFDERKEKRKKSLLIGSAVTVVALVLLTLAGFFLGHGWLFTNLPAEHKVSTFFDALEAKDYSKAYAIYTNDPDWQQHPEQHASYPIDRFTEDWTSESPVKAPITSHHVIISKTDGSGAFGTGMIVVVHINNTKDIFMWYQKSDGTLTWPAPHELSGY